MRIMKFGGTSVANGDRLRHAAGLVAAGGRPVVVVTSALGGVTDELVALGELARERRTEEMTARVIALTDRHREAIELIGGPSAVGLVTFLGEMIRELEQLLDGVSLLREVSPRTSDLLVSFGERMAAPLLAAAIQNEGVPASAVDARDIIEMEADIAGDGDNVVNQLASRDRTRALLLERTVDSVPVVTGFIAKTADGHTTTLGRGGSDYTATLLGSFLDAEEIIIWTDVDGVMTADPRVVPEARVLEAITYREAAEMAYFGSKVLHPSSMIPAVQSHIPVLIRNTFNPEHPGTRISDRHAGSAMGVKTVTSVPDLSLVTVEGNGMIGVPGVARRVFDVTARIRANVYMVSQASSEHNISFLVHQSEGRRVASELEKEFDREIAHRQIDPINVKDPVGIVAVIGEGMRGTPGIAERMFTALGRGHVNVLAIAQGSSELNLSTVVAAADLRRGVGAAHSRFGLTRDMHLFMLGKGLVGRTLLRQIADARTSLTEEHGIGLQVMGVAGSREWLFEANGLSERTLRRLSAGDDLPELGGGARPSDAEIFKHISDSRWLDVVIIDATAEENGQLHAEALRHGFHVVTANKKPMAGSLADSRMILKEAADRGLSYQFETTFGAGLPALSTLQELIATCDRIDHVQGCFSGTLGYICSQLEAGTAFSEAVRTARSLGFTEPDPRDDLNGQDVGRKALIIARQLGMPLEMSDIKLVGMISDELATIDDVETFLDRLSEMDDDMSARTEAARAEGKVLRYVAEISRDGVNVGLQDVPKNSPTGQLEGPDNILVFRTERYHEQPLIIRGPGAGAEVTAAGVLGDILKIVRTT